ncbi:hypothetical protein Peur_003456 [Populus x canadensis]
MWSINGSGVASNPGNNLYITGLSTRITSSDLEKYFNSEGKVLECHLVTDPHTRESRGFAFVTVETTEHADRCIKTRISRVTVHPQGRKQMLYMLSRNFCSALRAFVLWKISSILAIEILLSEIRNTVVDV